MDIHYRVVGALHIIEAAFFMLGILMMSLFFGLAIKKFKIRLA